MILIRFRKKRLGYRKKRDWAIVHRALRHRWMKNILMLLNKRRKKIRLVNYNRAIRLAVNAYMAHYEIDRRSNNENSN